MSFLKEVLKKSSLLFLGLTEYIFRYLLSIVLKSKWHVLLGVGTV